jgi:hypothetical protein
MSKSRGSKNVGKLLKGDKTLYFHVQNKCVLWHLYFHVQNKCVLWHLSSSKIVGHGLGEFQGKTIGHIKLHPILPYYRGGFNACLPND